MPESQRMKIKGIHGKRLLKNTKFFLEIHKDSILRRMELQKGDALYQEFAEAYDALLSEMKRSLKPEALFFLLETKGEEGPGQFLLACIFTIGKEPGEFSEKLIREGKFVEGLLANDMADAFLFQMDEETGKQAIEIAEQEHAALTKRMEAPRDFSFETQKKIWDALIDFKEKQGEPPGIIQRKESAMFDPVKTLCVVYLLEKENKSACEEDSVRKDFHMEEVIKHKCEGCVEKNCRYREM